MSRAKTLTQHLSASMSNPDGRVLLLLAFQGEWRGIWNERRNPMSMTSGFVLKSQRHIGPNTADQLTMLIGSAAFDACRPFSH